MSTDRPRSMTDAALDRALRSAFDVDPSPEFVARVRTRIAGEPRRGFWALRHLGMVAAAAALVVAAVAVLSREPQGPSSLEPAVLEPHQIAAWTALPPSIAPIRDMASAAATRPTGSATRVVQPEVVVFPAEAAALRRLFAGVDLAAPLSEPLQGDISIPLISIDSLALGSPEGARQ